MNIWTGLKLIAHKLFMPAKREYASFALAEKCSHFLYPKYLFSEFGRTWLEDADFLKELAALKVGNVHSADRKFFLRNLLKLAESVPGDTAECGAYYGASSWFICRGIAGKGKEHHVFDSFEGLSEPGGRDGEYWREGAMKASEEALNQTLSAFDFVQVHKGWIPEKFPEVADKQFCFVHIDVDLHGPTLDSLEFFYPRMATGGIVLCDDYGFTTCRGAAKAMDEFFGDRPEPIVHVPTGQGFVIKR